MKDLKLISDESKRFTIKNPKPIQKISTRASTKNSARPDKKELVRGYSFFRLASNSLIVILSILIQKSFIVYREFNI